MINGERIRELMKERGILGKTLASRVGVSEPMISFIFDGLREPSVGVLVRIATELGCTLDELVNKPVR